MTPISDSHFGDSKMHELDEYAAYDDFYDAPITDWADVGHDASADSPRVIRTPIPNGPSLFSHFGPSSSKTLYVTFHGAINRERDRYPRFDRVSSSAKRKRSLLSFADPTLTLTDTIGLGWYLGGQDWDPAESIVKTIRVAMDAVSASNVILLGGSGGGFAAMRVGALLPHSLIYAFSPQSSVTDYNARIVAEYFAAAFPGESQDSVVAADPDKFSMRSLFSKLTLAGPHLYYLQNANDKGHMIKHYAPMKSALGVSGQTGITADGKVQFMTYESDTPGHKPPSNEEFELHLKKAELFQRGRA